MCFPTSGDARYRLANLHCPPTGVTSKLLSDIQIELSKNTALITSGGYVYRRRVGNKASFLL